jgi:uncharacterized protein (DUF427 family)
MSMDTLHPTVTIEPCPDRVRILIDGHAIADTSAALILRENGLPPVHYIPREDVEMGFFGKTDFHTTCPLKGEASYYTAFFEGHVLDNVAWSYELPLEEVDEIAGHLAFDPKRVAIEETPP